MIKKIGLKCAKQRALYLVRCVWIGILSVKIFFFQDRKKEIPARITHFDGTSVN